MTTEQAEKSKIQHKIYDGRSFQPLPVQFFTLFLKSSEHRGTFSSMGGVEELFPGAGHRPVHQLFGTIGEERWTALFDQVERTPGTRIVVMRPCTQADLAGLAELEILKDMRAATAPIAA